MVRAAALALTAATGFTALVYEVAWHKYLAILLGAHSEATAAILAIFLGGLSVGYAVFGRLSRRIAASAGTASPRRILITYGILEGAIGIYALAFPMLFAAARFASLHLPHGHEAVAFAGDVTLSALLIGPPAVMMGATIPMLTQALASGLGDASRFHALVYAVNTAGACAGALAAAFVLIPWLGLQGSVLAMGILNLLAAAVFVALGRSGGNAPVIVTGGEIDELADPRSGGMLPFVVVALIGGFCSMGFQAIANRVGAFALGASEFTFAIVVAIFVVGISLGSFAVAALPSIRSGYLVSSQWAMVAWLLLLYPAVADASYWAYRLRSVFASVPDAFYPYHFAISASLFAVLAFPLAASGAMLPLLFHHLRDRYGRLGDTAGRLYAWNTVGSLLGALAAGYVALFWLDLDTLYRLLVALLAAGATLLSIRVAPRARLASVLALAATLAFLVASSPWPRLRLSAGLLQARDSAELAGAGPDRYLEAMEDPKTGPRLLYYNDDPTVSVAVVGRKAPDGTDGLSIKVNGKSDGDVPTDNVTMSMLGLVPALLAERTERAFVVGFGTGVTAGELAIQPGMKEVVVAEISPGVLEAAPLFRDHNLSADTLANVRLVRADAYRALLRSEGSYDLIVSEPSNPWMAGVEMLLSQEFLEAARGRLTPRGVYAQWFHIYAMDKKTMSLVFETYRRVFDRVAVWYALGTDLILLGFGPDAGIPAIDALETRFSREPLRTRFARIGIESLPELLAHELLPVGVVNAASFGDEVHTLTHPRLSHSAARAYFIGKIATPPATHQREAAAAGAAGSLLARYFAEAPDGLSAGVRRAVADETCTYTEVLCLALLARWWHDDPHSPELKSAIGEIGRTRDVAIDPQYLASMSMLFDPDGTSTLPARYDIANGVRVMFGMHYHHAVPFSSRALQVPWERCRTDPRCAGSLEAVRELGSAP